MLGIEIPFRMPTSILFFIASAIAAYYSLEKPELVWFAYPAGCFFAALDRRLSSQPGAPIERPDAGESGDHPSRPNGRTRSAGLRSEVRVERWCHAPTVAPV